MFDFMIFFLQASFLIGMIVGPITLLSLRIYYAIKHQKVLKEQLLIVLLPFSIGFYMKVKETNKFKTIYQELTVSFLILLIVGGILLIYLQLGVYYAF
jgi:hypothetical protein